MQMPLRDGRTRIDMANANHPLDEFKEISFREFWDFTRANKKILGLTTGIGATLSIVVALVLPVYFKSTALLDPPRGNSGSFMAGAMGQAASALSSIVSLPGLKDEATKYLGIIQSRRFTDALIKKHNYIGIYGCDYLDEARERFRLNLEVELTTEGLLSIAFSDQSADRAANVVNDIMEMLLGFNALEGVNSAKQEKSFLEKRIDQVKADLEHSEIQLKEFQEKHNIVSIDVQTNYTANILSELQQDVILTESRYNFEKRWLYSGDNVDLERLKVKVEETRKEIEKLRKPSKEPTLMLPIKEIPELSLQFLRLKREFTIQEILYEILVKNFEIAKIAEYREISGFKVVDSANVPELKDRPKRRLIVLLATMVSLLLGYAIAFARRKPEENPAL